MARSFDTNAEDISVPVQPYLRLIPNGITNKNGRRILRATLTVTPLKRKNNTSAMLDLVRWPICAADLFDLNDKGNFAHISAHARAATGKDPGAGVSDAADPLPIRPARHQHVDALRDNALKLTECWQASLITTDDMGKPLSDTNKKTVWTTLADRITAVLQGERTKVEGDLQDTTLELDDDTFGDNGQFQVAPETGKRTVHSVLSVPHSDTALVLEMQRGRELGLSLGDKGVETEREPPITVDPVPYEDVAPTIDEEAAKAKFAGNGGGREGILAAAKHIPLTLVERMKGDPADQTHDKQIDAWETQFYIVLFGKSDGSDEEMKAHADALKKWRNDNAEVLGEAQGVATQAALRLAKIERFKRLNEQMDPARRAAKHAFSKAKTALGANGAPDVCRYTSLAPADLKSNPAAKLDTARVASTVGLWEKHHNEGETPKEPTSLETANAIAGQGYFSIEASPGQARVFGLAMDVEIELGSALVADRFAVFSAISDEGQYGQDAATPWTLTKLKRYDGTHFGWPVTLGEYAEAHDKEDAAVYLPSHCIPQYDGVIVMGAIPREMTEEERNEAEEKGLPTSAGRLPRYDISTLDVSTALEAEKKWLEAIEDKKALLDSISGEGDDDSDRAEVARQLKSLLSVGPDYQSNGLTLLCRSAASDAIRKLAATRQKLCDDGSCVKPVNDQTGLHNQVIQDAEDLTNGFRALIGIPDATTGHTRWRSLMGRYFRYDRSGKDGRTIELVLSAAVGAAGSPERIAIESALTASPARDVAASADGTKIEAYVEESVSSWDGTPGGVACAGIGADDEDIMDVMCFGRRSYVPDRERDDKPPHLRNGRPYRFALQAVYAGGHAVPPAGETFPKEIAGPDNMEFENKGDVRARLFYPSRGLASHGSAQPYIRALRHQRIGAPSILIPRGHARRRNGPMGFESAGKMIVRTLRQNGDERPGSRDRSRATPALSQRVVVVPHLPLALATRQLVNRGNEGVFDRFSTDGPPPGGFPTVRYAKGQQGFPTVRTTFKSGINGEPYIDTRNVVQAAKTETTPEGEESASAVYWHRTDGNVRTDYYPDPAAETLVLRARKVAGQSGKRALLPGDPIAISLLPQGRRYPNNLPVLLSLSKDCTRPDDDPGTQASVIKPASGWTTFSANLTGDVRSGIRQRCASVDLCLSPGDQFDIEMWIVPSKWRLAHDFAPVQALVQYLCNLGGAKSGNCTKKSFIEGVTLFDGFPGEFCKTLVAAAKTFRTSGNRYIAPGGDIMPGAHFMQDFAVLLYNLMLTHPLPEIAATRTISAVHAVNVPKAGNKPTAVVLPHDLDPFPAKSCPDPACTLDDKTTKPVRAIRPETLDEPVASFADDLAISSGSKHLALTGEVELDLEKMDVIEVVARTVSPDSTIFDDPNRGRSLAHRLAGTWPDSIETPGKPRNAADVFGFRVARDGRVKLREGDVTLLRIDGLPFQNENQNSKRIDLDPYFLAIDQKKSRLTSRRHPFPDGKARRLRIQINGLARTAEYLTTVSRVARTGDPWLQGTGLVFEPNELIPSERLAPKWQSNLSDPMDVVMPATIRPAMVESLAPAPTFDHSPVSVSAQGKETVLTYTRHCMVQLRMRRSWFSSGVDEKLGIVLWPPEQILGDAPSLAVNRVPLRKGDGCDTHDPAKSPKCESPTTSESERWIQLLEFSDEDLGPGGKFVTRRGTDPVRMGREASETKETEVFLSRATFPDLWRHPDDPALAEFVPQVLMPLSDTDKEGNAMAGDASEKGEEKIDVIPPMSVGLVTYEPRFKIKNEEWFADVLLTPGRSADSWVRFGLVRYQPHTRPELRCSRPVEQWAQPLPERRVELRLSADRTELHVKVEGPVSRGRADEPAGMDPVTKEPTLFEAEVDKRDAPRLRLRAFLDDETPIGGEGRNTVSLLNAVTPLTGPFKDPKRPEREGFVVKNERGEDEAYEVNVDLIEGEGVWKADIQLTGLGTDLSRLRLKIEEIEYFLPSDLGEDEPVDPDFVKTFPNERWREHGVRFSKVFELGQMIETSTKQRAK